MCVIVESSPRKSTEAGEAMRLSVGLTLRDHEVYLILMGEGVDALGVCGSADGQTSSFRKPLEFFMELGHPLVVEREAVEGCGALCSQEALEIWSREEIYRFLTRCDGVILVRDWPPGETGGDTHDDKAFDHRG